jgi:hypothetical protein
MELTAEHPRARTAWLWRELHGIEMPTSPVASDAVAVLEEIGLDVGIETESRLPQLWQHEPREEMVAFLRRQLCLAPERDADIEALVGDNPAVVPGEVVTLWWDPGG